MNNSIMLDIVSIIKQQLLKAIYDLNNAECWQHIFLIEKIIVHQKENSVSFNIRATAMRCMILIS